MVCEECKEPIEQGEEYQHMGKNLCEDCYIQMLEPPRSCDVTAVYSAKKARLAAGQTGTDGLSDLQKDIYNFIKEQGKATQEQIAKQFKLPLWQAQKQFATLRHCELIKATRKNGVIYMVLMEGGPGTLEV